jgi:hypothetical protein
MGRMSDEERKKLVEEYEQDRPARAAGMTRAPSDKLSSHFPIREIAGVVASLSFIVGGVKMLGIESQAGDTIFEAFFQAMAFVSFGLAAYSFGRLVVQS